MPRHAANRTTKTKNSTEGTWSQKLFILSKLFLTKNIPSAVHVVVIYPSLKIAYRIGLIHYNWSHSPLAWRALDGITQLSLIYLRPQKKVLKVISVQNYSRYDDTQQKLTRPWPWKESTIGNPRIRRLQSPTSLALLPNGKCISFAQQRSGSRQPIGGLGAAARVATGVSAFSKALMIFYTFYRII